MSTLVEQDTISRQENAEGFPFKAVRVIAKGKLSTDQENQLEETIRLKRDAILTISSWGHINYSQGGESNAGLELRILIDGEPVAIDTSFEAQTGTGSFFASASYSAFLEKGNYKLQILRKDIGLANQQPLLRATYHAVAARDVSHL